MAGNREGVLIGAGRRHETRIEGLCARGYDGVRLLLRRARDTSCMVCPVFFHSTVVPVLILSFCGTNLGGLSVIVTVTVFPAALAGVAYQSGAKAKAVTATRSAGVEKRRRFIR